MPASLRYAVLGVGGIGGYFGGLMASKGLDVTFVARGDTLAALKAHGLHVQSVNGQFSVPSVQVTDQLTHDSVDVVLLCVKTYQNSSVLHQLRALPSAVILSIQNGIDNDHFFRRSDNRIAIYPGYAHIVSSKQSPNVVSQTGGPRTLHFGTRGGDTVETLQTIETQLRSAGISAHYERNIEAGMWEKFIFLTAFSGFTSLGRCSIGAVLSHKPAFAALWQGCLEAISLAKCEGVSLAQDIEERLRERFLSYETLPAANSTSSMSRDLISGARTEIATLSGKLSELGRLHGIATPIHDMISIAVQLGEKPNEKS